MEIRVELCLGTVRAPVRVRFSANATVADLRMRIIADAGLNLADFVGFLLCGPEKPIFSVSDGAKLRFSGIRSGWRVWLCKDISVQARCLPSPPPAIRLLPRALVDLRMPESEVIMPSLFRVSEKQRLPWLSMLLPLILAGVMAVVFRNPATLAFMALAPVLMLSNYLQHRRKERKTMLRNKDKFIKAREEVRAAIDEAHSVQRDISRDLAPGVNRLSGDALSGNHLFWSQMIGAENRYIRIGLGTVESGIRTREADRIDEAEDEGHAEQIRELKMQAGYLNEAAILLTERVTTVFGEKSESFLRAIILQYAMFYNPENLCIAVLHRPGRVSSQWNWLGWLPHVIFVPSTDDVEDKERTLLVALENHKNLDITGFFRVLLQVREDSEIPGFADCWVDAGGKPSVTVRQTGDTKMLDSLETIGGNTAEIVARRIASLACLSDVSRLRKVVNFADVYASKITAEKIIECWHKPEKQVLLGVSATGAQEIDLFTDGPHALIVGTTGSGKSELLQTWVTAMGVSCSPKELNFLFIDYKGGAAFREFASIPHTAGFVTDLDDEIIERVFIALQNTLREREQILANAGVSCVSEMSVQHNFEIPRLVIFVDEFATLAKQTQEFLPKLFDIAARGRSLGIHLVLATQHTGAHVSQALKANINIKIALRTIDKASSRELIASDIAANFPVDTPGRAALQIGGQEPVVFQSASVHMCLDGQKNVTIEDLCSNEPADSYKSTENAVVGKIMAAANKTGMAAVSSLWNAPLPFNLTADQEPLLCNVSGAIGLGEDMQTHSRRAVNVSEFVTHNTVFYGVLGSGTTSTMRNIVRLSNRGFYVVTHDTQEWQQLADRQNLGAVCDANDVEHINRVLSFIEQGRANEPVLMIDGLRHLLDAGDKSRILCLRERLTNLVLEGKKLGVTVLVGVTRLAEVPAVLHAGFTQHVVYRLAQDFEAQTLGVRHRNLSQAKPGRAVFMPSGVEMQFCSAVVELASCDASAEKIAPLPEKLFSDSNKSILHDLEKGSGFTIPSHTMLITAPPGSGGTTAARMLNISKNWEICDLRETDEVSGLIMDAIAAQQPKLVLLSPGWRAEVGIGVSANISQLPHLILNPTHRSHNSARYMPVGEHFLASTTPGRGWFVHRGVVRPVQVPLRRENA